MIEKIVVNAGVGRLSQQGNFTEKILPQVIRDLGLLAGQKPQFRSAKKSIAGFKIREGQVVGLRVTLRGRRAVDFFERFLRIVLPRVRDFSGISRRAVDAHGILNVGLKEQLVFPEINPEDSPVIFPLGVNIVPRTKNRAAAMGFYEELGVPFQKK
jgi:large subunit ribosomal protein L5